MISPYGSLGNVYGQSDMDAPAQDGSGGGGGGAGFTDYLAPIISGLTGQFKDPVRQAGVLRAELQRAIVQGRSWDHIQKIRARLAAAERQAVIAEEKTTDRRAWSQIGQVAAVAGVGVLLTIGLYYGAKTIRGT